MRSLLDSIKYWEENGKHLGIPTFFQTSANQIYSSHIYLTVLQSEFETYGTVKMVHFNYKTETMESEKITDQLSKT